MALQPGSSLSGSSSCTLAAEEYHNNSSHQRDVAEKKVYSTVLIE